MDDLLCQNYFLQPNHTQHRRYEALRSVFVDHRPLLEVAQTFGYRYGTLRNLVSRLRSHCRAGVMPPFSILPTEDALQTPMSISATLNPTQP